MKVEAIKNDDATTPNSKPTTAAAKSFAFETLPGWVKPFWSHQLIPSLVEFYGAQDDPWDLDDNENDIFYCLLQKLVDALYPEQHHILVKPAKTVSLEDSKIYAIVSAISLKLTPICEY